MKKKILAWVLILTLVMSSMPIGAFAAVDEAYGVKMTGITNGAGDVLDLTLAIKGPKVAYDSGQASVGIKIDSTKLRLVKVNGSAAAISTTSFTSVTAAGKNLDPDQYYLSNVGVLGKEDIDKNIIYIAYQPTFNAEVELTDYTDLMSIRLEYQNGATEDDLDKTSIQLITVDESYALGQNNIAYIATQTNANGMQYGINDRGSGDENLARPEIVYPNSDVENLNGVKLDAANKYINVPQSLPTVGSDVTVNTTVQGYYSSDCATGTELNDGVSYTYDLNFKGESETEADALTDEEAATVSIDNNGVVTVKAGAPQGTLVISATGSYTNSKNNVSNATGTFELGLRHGDAYSKNEEDPAKPPKPVGGEPSDKDADKELAGVEIYLEGDGDPAKVIAADATNRNYDYTVAKPAPGTTPASATFSAKEVDQYGDEMATAVGAWSMDAATGITHTNGTLSIDDTVANGNYTLTYTAGAITSTVTVIVADNAIVWPILDKNSLTYGEKVSDLTFTGGTASDSNGVIAGATFSWDTPEDVPGAGSKVKVTMSCKNGEDVIATKDYEITVNKADQLITIAGDAEGAERTSLAIPRGGDGFDLQTTVTNKDVPTATGMSTATYTIADPTIAEMGATDETANVIKGLRISDSGTTLTITAAENDNYNAVSRTLAVKVGKELLDAQITLTPADNLKFNETVTANVVENTAQPGSLTTDCTYQWYRVDPTNEDNVVPIEGATGNLIINGDGTVQDITYQAQVGDIGSRLRIAVITGTAGGDSYEYADKSIATMTNAVTKQTQGVGAWVAQKTTTSITVDEITGAEYAIEQAVVAPAAEGDTLAWQDSNVFNGLTPNTKYNVYVRMKETETHSASAPDKKEVTTDKIAINDETDPLSPQGGAVTLSGKSAVGETLTATITDPTLNGNPVAVLSTGTIQWLRVTPAVVDNPETADVDETAPEQTEVIEGETGLTYTAVEADADKIIRVVVTANADSEYSGSVQVDSDVITNGHNITGVVVSYNAKNPVNYELYAWDAETGAYSETAIYTGVAVEAAETTTASKQTQDFIIEGISDGRYKLVIKKSVHLSFTIVGLEVNGADIDLTSETYPDRIKSIALAAGDVDGNGAVNVTDAGRVTYPTNYNATDLSVVPNPEADIDGNNAINVTDRGVITHPDNYNKQESDFVVEL